MPQLPESMRNTNLIDDVSRETIEDLPVLQEWAFDFDTHQFKRDENGLPYLVSRNEALKIWLYWAVTTEKGKWSANSNTYGAEIEHMIGLPISTALRTDELKRTVTEAIENFPYIKEIKKIELRLEDEIVIIDVELKSIYSEGWDSYNVKV